MKTFLARFANDESGATAIEYGLIAAHHRRCHRCRRTSDRYEPGALFNNIAGDLD